MALNQVVGIVVVYRTRVLAVQSWVRNAVIRFLFSFCNFFFFMKTTIDYCSKWQRPFTKGRIATATAATKAPKIVFSSISFLLHVSFNRLQSTFQ